MLRWTLIPMLLVGCAGGGEDSDAPAGNVDPDTDLTDNFNVEEDGSCETFYDEEDDTEYAIPGAQRFWVGEFAINGTEVTGYEAEVLFANDSWVAEEPDAGDCQIVWTMTGTKGDPAGCGSCEYSLTLHAEFDAPTSNCLAALQNDTVTGNEEFDVVYNVDVNGSETTYYMESNEVLGHGTDEGGVSTYVSESACMWF